jgi:DNA-binding CsgD family transcriptional regulator
VNTSNELRAEQTVDLSRLTDAERAVLRLLAEGHTAKTIANSIGSTPAAVNERLREARRKTGLGSSREVARLLRARENRDKQFGVAIPTAVGANPAHQDADAPRRVMGVIVMIAFLGAAAAAMFITAERPVPKTVPHTITDPAVGTFEVVGSTWLYRAIRQEDRDTSWAGEAERALRDRYSTVRFFDEKPQLLRVMCGYKTCEVAAVIPQPKLHTSYGDEERSIIADMRKDGLVQVGAAITNDKRSNHTIYLAYFLRAAESSGGGSPRGDR